MPARLVPLAVGRTAGAVSGLADSGLVHRLTRGRLWIGALTTLLVGIVALNVLALSLNASSSKVGRQADSLKRQISALRAEIATNGASNQRIQEAAAKLGLIVPAPGVGRVPASQRRRRRGGGQAPRFRRADEPIVHRGAAGAVERADDHSGRAGGDRPGPRSRRRTRPTPPPPATTDTTTTERPPRRPRRPAGRQRVALPAAAGEWERLEREARTARQPPGRRQGRRAMIERRIGLLFACFLLLFVIAIGRAAWVQGVQGGGLAADAQSQQTQTVTIPGRRGRILDRNGKELAVSEDAADVIATPYQVKTRPRPPGAWRRCSTSPRKRSCARSPIDRRASPTSLARWACRPPSGCASSTSPGSPRCLEPAGLSRGQARRSGDRERGCRRPGPDRARGRATTTCSAAPTASARWCSTGSARRSSATRSAAPSRARTCG